MARVRYIDFRQMECCVYFSKTLKRGEKSVYKKPTNKRPGNILVQGVHFLVLPQLNCLEMLTNSPMQTFIEFHGVIGEIQ